MQRSFLAAAIRWLPVGVWAGLIFLLSHQPSLPQLGPPLASSIAHFVEYLVLAFLLARAAGSRGGALGAPLYGISDELHQAFVPGRTATMEDWLFDAAGSLAGVWLHRVSRQLRGWPS